MQLTFDGLPEAVSQLFNKLENIEHLLLQRNKSTLPESEDLITIKQASEFIRLSVATIYGLVSRREIPSMKKGNRLYFSKNELTEWIKAGRKLTIAETACEVDNYLSSIKKRRVIA